MTVGDCRWPLNCLSSPLFPVLWHLLQLNVAIATPLFYVVHPLSFGSSFGDVNHLYYPPKLSVPNFLHFPWQRVQSTVVSSETTSPLTPFPDQSLLILIYWYGVLSKKFQASFSSTTSQKTRFCFYPISFMSIPPLHTETLPRPLSVIRFWKQSKMHTVTVGPI